MTDLSIKIPKAGRSFVIDTDRLPVEVYQLALMKGLADLAQSGITSTKFPTKGLEGEELANQQAAIAAKIEENIENIYLGKVKVGRASPTTSDGKKVSREVMTEARRLAKEVVKDEIRAAGEKPSHYEPRDITSAANALLDTDPTLFEMARANIEARAALTKPVSTDDDEIKLAAMAKLDALGGLRPSPKKLAEAEKAKAERKTQLSAKQATKAAPRKKLAPSATAN